MSYLSISRAIRVRGRGEGEGEGGARNHPLTRFTVTELEINVEVKWVKNTTNAPGLMAHQGLILSYNQSDKYRRAESYSAHRQPILSAGFLK